jgi:hypothetical protein
MKTENQKLKIKVLTGPEARCHFEQITEMRLRNFKEYPYLYKGNKEYEWEYLNNSYFSSPSAQILLVLEEDKIVGFANTITLTEEVEHFKKPFIENCLNTDDYLYIGEVFLDPEYRCRSLFYNIARWIAQRAVDGKYKNMLCYSVLREDTDPRRPGVFRPVEDLWKKLGFSLEPALTVKYSWPQVDTDQEEENTLAAWVRKIQPGEDFNTHFKRAA